ncbi:unnamed protein product, partial [Scytosiphon promiscuus]
MERDAFASLFSQPQRGNNDKKKSKRTSSQAASPRKHHVNSALSRSNKRPRSSAASPSSLSSAAASSPPAGSRFVECPLCGKSVHSSLAQSHVERCVGREDIDAVPNEAVKSAPLLATTTAPSIPPSSPTGGLPGVTTARISPSPPAVGDVDDAGSVLSPDEAGHGPPATEVSPSPVMDEVPAAPDAGTSGKKAAGGTPVAGTAAAAAAAVSLAHSTASNSPPPPPVVVGAGGGTPAGKGRRGTRRTSTSTMDPTTTVTNNAFAKLMAASALTNFREEMYLWAHEDGTLSWGWGTVGNPLPPPPSVPSTNKNGHVENGGGGSSGAGVGTTAPTDHRRWSCQVATKGPDGRKAGMCDLWTNLSPAQSTASAGEGRTAGQRSAGGAPAIRPAASDENAGLKAARPRQSLSRLPVAVIKSMLQKNVRRGRAAAAVRCALELALKSWNDAIRRVLVIIVEDSLLHPAAPLLTWLMVATSKGYRPPHRLLEAFLCVVYETAACPVRDSTESSRRRRRRHLSSASGSQDSNDRLHQEQQQQSTPAASFDADDFSIPHPQSLLSFATTGGGGDADGYGCRAAAG